MSVRGVIFPPLAMARPNRSAGEQMAIHVALSAMPADLSARSKARCLAQRVVGEMIAADRREDPMEIALAAALQAVNRDPVVALAEQLAGDLAQERLSRFEARGCRQLPGSAWEAETMEIAGLLEKRLARKFRNK